MGTVTVLPSPTSTPFPCGPLAGRRRPESDSQGLGCSDISPLASSLPFAVPSCCLGPNPLRPPAEAQRLPYYATYCPTRLLIHSMCTSHYLDIFITFIICLNVVTMSLEHYNQPTVSPSPSPSLRSHGRVGSSAGPRARVRQEGLSSTPIRGLVPRKLMAWCDK